MMQMLVAGGFGALVDDQRPADESNARGYFEYAPVAGLRSDSSWVPAARGKVVKVVVPLVTALPRTERYCVVMMRRSLERMMESQSAMLDRLGKTGASLSREQLARVFASQLEHSVQFLEEQESFSLLSVDFDELVGHPEAEVERLVAFLGGSLDRHAMVEVVDPSLRHH